jgi:uncharacterized protein with von Willebrand factor type A (vWA) domain
MANVQGSNCEYDLISFSDQVPFVVVPDDLAMNPEPRCPCLLLLDTSGSMRGKPMAELNARLRIFEQ